MRKILLFALLFLLLPVTASAGSQTYSTPGTYQFTVPTYGTLTVKVWGGGGGGGGILCEYAAGQRRNGTAGSASSFGSMSANGGGGGTCNYWSSKIPGQGGSGGTASGGTTNTTGAVGANGAYNWLGGVGGSAPSGGAGGGGGSPSARHGRAGVAPGAGGGGGGAVPPLDPFQGGGGGGSGGYSQRTYSAGQLSGRITVSVGAAGLGGQYAGSNGGGGGAGAPGRVTITWTDATPSCTLTLAPSTVNQGAGSTLSWTTQNAYTTANPPGFHITNIGYIPPAMLPNGSTSVTFSQTTTFTGTVTGPGGSAQCSATLTVRQSCTLPWGGSITHGQSTTAYQNSTVPYNQTCVSQTRTCSNGTLSGSYQHQSCSVQPAANCTLGGVTVLHGQSRTFYSQQTAPIGNVCSSVSQSRTCTNGTLSGSAAYQYASCSCAAIYSCSGQTIRYTNTSCVTSSVTTCVSPYFCSPGSATCMSPEPAFVPFSGGSGHLQARPQIVRSGLTAYVFWNVANVQSCTVAGSNGDSWTGLTSGASGRETSAIFQQTAYTLSCVPLTGGSFSPETLLVNILPSFQER